MSDIRALLEDTTARPAAHPDPVGAVHHAVKQRTRRQIAATAVATLAVLAGGVAASGLAGTRDRDEAEPAITEGNLNFPAAWRGLASFTFVEDEAFRRIGDVVGPNREVFVGFKQTYKNQKFSYDVAFSADADPDEWADELAAAAGDRELRVTQCDRTAAHLDRVAVDVLTARFPSGARIGVKGLSWDVRYQFPCQVLAATDQKPTAADHVYARARWGDDVVVMSARETGFYSY